MRGIKTTFKLSENDINYLLKLVEFNTKEFIDKKTPLQEKLESIAAWMATMPESERYVYLLGRKA